MKIKRQLAVILLAGMLIGLAPNAAQAFSDTRMHWARQPIDHLQSRGLLSGYPDASFRPDAYVTREEFATVLVRALNKGDQAQQLAGGDSFFIDMQQRWSRGYVALARELGITQGDGQGYFHPQRIVTRQEAVTMMVNALDPAAKNGSGADLFKDSRDIEDWARDAVAYAYENEIIKGFPDGTFRPRNAVTRAQVAVMTEQFLDMRGQKYHFTGTLREINLYQRKALIELNGNEQTFDLSEMITIYKSGQQAPVTELKLPSAGYFDVNAQGKLTYAYLVDELPAVGVEIRTSHLPVVGTAALNSTALVRLADETTDENRPELLNEPGTSLENTRQAMRVHEFIKKTGATGRGQLVAIIDSGVDPGHPDLQNTSDGFPTLVDYLDFTNEGRVALTGIGKPLEGSFKAGTLTVGVGGIPNLAGDFRYGYLDASVLPASFQTNLAVEKFLVVAAATEIWNYYDTVYVDTDGDGDIAEEKPLKRFSSGQYASIVNGSKRLNLAVTEISTNPAYIKLGFDGLGHGTEVAGIVAANGQVVGMAPGAQLLAVKVLDRLGQASIQVMQQALEAAGQRGARVAVLSLGQYQLSSADHDRLAATAELMWKKYRMIICMAAGNNGPGISTVTRSSSINNVLSVGAYATPQMWYRDYGWKVEESTLWYFSSAGPSLDGLLAPTLLAPGNAISTYPLWGDYPYRLDEGTSMAAPHAAGAVALLLDVAVHQLYTNDTQAVYQALISGAVPLDNLQPAEQGFGTVNLIKSWEHLKDAKDSFTAYQVSQYTPGYGYGSGLYSRGLLPGRISVEIENTSSTNRQLAMGGLSDWIKPAQLWMQVPAGSQRRVNIDYGELDKPGLYSDFLVADDMDTPGTDLNILQTVLVPYDLADLPGHNLVQEDSLLAGQFKRYFIRVSEGAAQLDLQVDAGKKGRVRMHVISPVGWQEVSAYAGVGETATDNMARLTFTDPPAGVWEVVVYSSASLSAFDLKQSKYTFKANLIGLKTSSLRPSNLYLISSVPRQYKAGEPVKVTLNFWNITSKTPARGVVMINDRLYEMEQGTVTLDATASDTPFNFNISW